MTRPYALYAWSSYPERWYRCVEVPISGAWARLWTLAAKVGLKVPRTIALANPSAIIDFVAAIIVGLL